MCANICISNTEIAFLVDTGAGTTIISVQTWEHLCSAGNLAPLTETGASFADVDGRPLQVKGKCNLTFKFHTLKIPVQVLVASITAPGLLGIDFLREHECLIQLGGEPLLFVGRTRLAVPLCETPLDQPVRVALVETVFIPAESEIMVSGVLELMYGVPPGKLNGPGLLETKPGVPESRHVMVGLALVDTSRRTVPIRLLNGTSNPVTLYKGTHVGIVSPIANVVEVDEVENNYTSGLPAEMEDLLHRSGEGVPDCERIRLRQFLQDDRSVFSCEGDPLGRIGLVKHCIDTGDATPIRQLSRRLPFHKQVEAQAEVNEMLTQGVISPSKSAWSSPVVLVKKKDGSLWFCIDYRR